MKALINANKHSLLSLTAVLVLSACTTYTKVYEGEVVEVESGTVSSQEVLAEKLEAPQTDIVFDENTFTPPQDIYATPAVAPGDALPEESPEDDEMSVMELEESNFEDYVIGPGDVLNISVFRVDELSQSYEINVNNQILMPLLGLVSVRGMTVKQFEAYLVEELGRDLLNDPQVTIAIESYRPRNVSIYGAVSAPGLYKLTGNPNIFELLNQAGGITEEVGKYLYIRTLQRSPEGVERPVVLSVVVNDLSNPLSDKAYRVQKQLENLILLDGDVVFVQEAGSIYVDGPIGSPGKYSLAGDLTILQLLAVAGGVQFVGSEKKMRVVRRDENGVRQAYKVNVAKIRNLELPDFPLKNGDLVTVGTNYLALAFQATFDYIVRIYYLFLVI